MAKRYRADKITDYLNIDYSLNKVFMNAGNVSISVHVQTIELLIISNSSVRQSCSTELFSLLLSDVDVSNLCRFIWQDGFTNLALQKDKLLRQQYIKYVSIIP